MGNYIQQGQPASNPLAVFDAIKNLEQWVPYYLQPSATRPGKTDKIPATKAKRLSTKDPSHWMTLEKAFEEAQAFKNGGVGLVMTGGVQVGAQRLVGFDFDDVTEAFRLPVTTYAERSPSGKGVRAFAWVDADALTELADCTSIAVPDCDHAEVYIGTAPRFLTVTFDHIDASPKALAALPPETIKHYLKPPPAPDVPIPELDPSAPALELVQMPWLTDKHRRLLAGAVQPAIDRSAVLYSMLCMMAVKGVNQSTAVATIKHHPVLWKLCIDHRPRDPEAYAVEQSAKAYSATYNSGMDQLRSTLQAREGKPSVFAPLIDSKAANLVDPFKGHPPFIVANALPVDNGVMAGPGGAGKSTVCLWEAIHIALGMNVWGQRVLRPGPSLFLTAEDGAIRLKRRLTHLMDSLKLTPAQRKHVEDNIYVQDLVGKNFRLAIVESGGTVKINEDGIDELVDLYKSTGVSVVNIDPLSHFSAGERFINDNESSVNAAAARVSRGLNCFVRLVSHVSKAVHRDGIDDQYVGRGGAALADNSRQMMQLRVESTAPKDLPHKARLLLDALPDASIIGVYFHKVTDAKPWTHPIYLVRNGWRFHEFTPTEPDTRSQAELDRDDLEKIKRFLLANADIHLSKRDLERRAGAIGVKRAMVSTLIDEGVDRGVLVVERVDVPGSGAPKLAIKPA